MKIIEKKIITKYFRSKYASIKHLKVDTLEFTDIFNVLAGRMCPTGPTGQTGNQGPALFTLINVINEANLNSNSITTSNTSIYTVKTIEMYNTAFLTFRLNTTSLTSIGLVSLNNINTFAFGFDFRNDNTFSIILNAVSTGSYNYNNGDIFSICLTSFMCKLYQNGNLINSAITDSNKLNVFSQFYINDIVDISNISFGYLSDPLSG